MTAQQTRHNIAAITFCNGTEVEHGARVGLLGYKLIALVHHLELIVADESQDTVHLMLVRHLPSLESEAPGIDQRSHRYVERSFTLFVHCLCQIIHLHEHFAQYRLLSAVYFRNR